MPIKFVHRDLSKELEKRIAANQKRILRESTERIRAGTRQRMREDTGAQKESVYTTGPGFNDFFERQMEAAKLYEDKPLLPGVPREMKLLDEYEPPNEHTAATGVSAGHGAEWELGLGVSAEPSLLPAAEEERPRFWEQVAREIFK